MSAKSKKLLSRDQILAVPDLPFQDVEIPEWKGTVRIQGMTVAQRTAWEQSLTRRYKGRDGQMVQEVNLDKFTTFRQRLVALCAVDENGDRLFSDDDVAALEKKSAAAIERLVNVANKLNGVSQQDLQELEGNSEATGDADSSSDLPLRSGAPSLN